ncbi:MAG: tRNA (guanosine(46)-N7)-methyltransferase TrmB [Bacilli bacterium]|nr:tRNA (guanosine(46)-N7)-methyltransferase TrmB [Bacilli bacterium]MBN2877757.1 tRNA (guanosine(46)-N7)-methyltransferase TrmB [Bacilli bacterium]
MRLRNVKHAKETLQIHPDILIPHPEKMKGKWNSVFANENPIHVEIGCGKGKFIVESAMKHPDINYIGIEKFDSVILRALEKLIEKPIPNVRLIRMDAETIETVFQQREVSVIYLNFSDPWPKKRTAKRRLTSARFLNRYLNIMKLNSSIKIKTDNYSLFEFSMMEFNHHPQYQIEEVNLDLYRRLPEDNVQTEFEEKFVAQGNRIYSLDVTCRGVLK